MEHVDNATIKSQRIFLPIQNYRFKHIRFQCDKQFHLNDRGRAQDWPNGSNRGRGRDGATQLIPYGPSKGWSVIPSSDKVFVEHKIIKRTITEKSLVQYRAAVAEERMNMQLEFPAWIFVYKTRVRYPHERRGAEVHHGVD